MVILFFTNRPAHLISDKNLFGKRLGCLMCLKQGATTTMTVGAVRSVHGVGEQVMLQLHVLVNVDFVEDTQLVYVIV